MTVCLSFLLLALTLNLYLFKDKLVESMRYSSQIKTKLSQGHDSSILKFLKCIRIPLAFTLAQVALLVFLVVEFVGMVSN